MALGGRSRSYLPAGPRKHRKIRGPEARAGAAAPRGWEARSLRPGSGLGRLGEDAGGRVAEGGGPRAHSRARGAVRGSRRAKRASPSWSLAFWETSSPRPKLTDSAPDDVPFLPPSSQDPSLLTSGGLPFVFPVSIPLQPASPRRERATAG